MQLFNLFIGGIIGTSISVLFFANASKFGIAEGWHFFLDGQADLMRTKNKFLIYFPRFILGGILLPSIYFFIWGVDGILGIHLFNSHIVSAIALSLVESPIMIAGIYSRIMDQPQGSSLSLSIMAIIGHANLGFWIGLSALL